MNQKWRPAPLRTTCPSPPVLVLTDISQLAPRRGTKLNESPGDSGATTPGRHSTVETCAVKASVGQVSALHTEKPSPHVMQSRLES
jgi:hypothetical protein